MPTAHITIERAGELKAELVEYGLGKRFIRAYEAEFERHFAGRAEFDDEEIVNHIDSFVLQHRLPDGRTVLDRFVAARGELPRAERDMLRAWTKVVEGMFELAVRDHDGVVATNVIDELPYRICSNMGPAAFDPIPDRGIFVARLVPFGERWLVSGSMAAFGPEHRERLYAVAAEQAMRHPEACFRNPAKLALAREIQSEGRRHFIDLFGTDLVVVPGPRFLDTINGFYDYDVRARAADRGESGPERPWRPMQDDGGLGEAETVALIYDDLEGLEIFAEFGIVQEVFADPDLLRDAHKRATVMGYLRDDSVSPLPFRRLAAQDPDRASQVFARLLNRPGFTWSRDGERLLRSAKPAHAHAEPLPRIAPIGDHLARHLRPTAASALAPA